MAAVMQAESRPLAHDYTVASGDLGHDQIYNERVWAKAIHRIVTESISPEQAVDEAIARIKEILSGSCAISHGPERVLLQCTSWQASDRTEKVRRPAPKTAAASQSAYSACGP